MIVSWRNADAELLYETGKSRRVPANLRVSAVKKLLLLATAGQLSDLLAPPGNRLEALVGDRAGQHSIRINDQYRICFLWLDGNAHQVEIVDYH